MNLALLVLAGLIGLGLVLVAHGTVTRNRWGINVSPVSCPRCGTSLPQFRQARGLRQALWGGGTCANCGAEVDKWGRETTSPGRIPLPARPYTAEEARRIFKRRLVIGSLATFFPLTLLFDWPEAGLTLSGWVILLAEAVTETAIFTALFAFSSLYMFDRWFLRRDLDSRPRHHGSDQRG